MKFRWMRFALLSLVIWLGGCAVANVVVDPWTKLQFQPTNSINPDISGRASPLVVRVYELSSWYAFHNSDFFDLYDNAKSALVGELISVDEIVIRPGKDYEYPMSLDPNTRYVGIVAAFRDIQNARWRLVSEVEPRSYETINVAIDRLTLKQSRD